MLPLMTLFYRYWPGMSPQSSVCPTTLPHSNNPDDYKVYNDQATFLFDTMTGIDSKKYNMDDDDELLRPNKIPRVENTKNQAQESVDKPARAVVALQPDIPRWNVLNNSRAFDSDAFEKAFRTFKVIHLSNVVANTETKSPPSSAIGGGTMMGDVATWKDLGNLYQTLNEEDQASWCIETAVHGGGGGNGSEKEDQPPPTSDEFLKPQLFTSPEQTSAYCSFLVQKDTTALADFVSRLPLQTFEWCNHWWYEPCLWIFFGRNRSPSLVELQGRPEHTDSISHDVSVCDETRLPLCNTNTLAHVVFPNPPPVSYYCVSGHFLVANHSFSNHTGNMAFSAFWDQKMDPPTHCQTPRAHEGTFEWSRIRPMDGSDSDTRRLSRG
jgi:hypothetical protein